MNNTTNNVLMIASAELSRHKMLDPNWGVQGKAKVLSLDDVKQIEDGM
jgi:hypothetical protein